MKTLKTLSVIVVVAVLGLMSTSVNAQVTSANDNVTLTAHLLTNMSLTLGSSTMEFTFDELADYNDGVSGEATHEHTLAVESTSNWKLAVIATALTLDGEIETIPLDQVGFHFEATGAYADNKTTNSATATLPWVLSTTSQDVLTPAAAILTANMPNAGGTNQNAYDVKYQMGTQKSTMNSNSFLYHNYKKGSYESTITYTISEVLI